MLLMVRRVPASLALIRSMRLAVRRRSCLLPKGTRLNRSSDGFAWESTESLMDAREREGTMLAEPSKAAPEESCGHGHHGRSRQVAADHGGWREGVTGSNQRIYFRKADGKDPSAIHGFGKEPPRIHRRIAGSRSPGVGAAPCTQPPLALAGRYDALPTMVDWRRCWHAHRSLRFGENGACT
jgi:hypothetical protein